MRTTLPAVAASIPPPAVEDLELLVKGQLAQVKDKDKVTHPLGQDVSELLESYLNEVAAITEIEKLAKTFPRVVNVPNMKVPKLDEEIYQAVDQTTKNLDQSFQGIQKGILGAMAAVARS